MMPAVLVGGHHGAHRASGKLSTHWGRGPANSGSARLRQPHSAPARAPPRAWTSPTISPTPSPFGGPRPLTRDRQDRLIEARRRDQPADSSSDQVQLVHELDCCSSDPVFDEIGGELRFDRLQHAMCAASAHRALGDGASAEAASTEALEIATHGGEGRRLAVLAAYADPAAARTHRGTLPAPRVRSHQCWNSVQHDAPRGLLNAQSTSEKCSASPDRGSGSNRRKNNGYGAWPR